MTTYIVTLTNVTHGSKEFDSVNKALQHMGDLAKFKYAFSYRVTETPDLPKPPTVVPLAFEDESPYVDRH